MRNAVSVGWKRALLWIILRSMAKITGKTRSLAEIASRLVDPLLSRRAGISTMLLSAWEEIVGERFAATSRPERIYWPREEHGIGEGTGFSPGRLTIACEGANALFLMHEERELVSRVNAFLGFPAINGVRLVQKPVCAKEKRRQDFPLDRLQKERLDAMLSDIDDLALRRALEKLGEGVMKRKENGF